jgi:hypothetical protein
VKRVLLATLALITLSCGQKFEPDLRGWQAYAVPARPRVHVEIDGRELDIELPGEGVGYRFPQWTKLHDHMLLSQIVKTKACYDYQIIEIDTAGTILDTVYTAPPNTPVNFKLAPNDTLMLLKTYDDVCEDNGIDFKYTFYDRYTRKSLGDTIAVGNAAGIMLNETVWSPDSRKVILSSWSGPEIKAVVYDLVTKDTTFIDMGSNFIWSPVDKNLIAYIKDYSIYSMNMESGVKEMIFQGKRKKKVMNFRWNPSGDFLMIHIRGYILNIESEMTWKPDNIYLSMKERQESKVFYHDEIIQTWKIPTTH